MEYDQRQLLGGITVEEFLERYWQKEPYLIRQAIPDFHSFINKQELAKLACEEDVESRLVIEQDGEYPWQVQHGPLDQETFNCLPDKHWTLLVQNAELHLVQAAALLQRFNFIPNWRVDDLMISFAPEHGGIGPHLDSYDVFLLQASGKKQWSINTDAYDENDFIPGLDLRIIDTFTAQQTWLLNAGDMLYLPPGIAHHGVALDDNLTFSIGFRAPSQHELLSQYMEDKYQASEDQRYQDPNLKPQAHAGEITADDLSRLYNLAQSALDKPDELRRWFGGFITRLPDDYVYPRQTEAIAAQTFLTRIQSDKVLYRQTATRTAFIREHDGFLLFINGHLFSLPVACEDFVYQFTEKYKIEYSVIAPILELPEFVQTLCQLYNLELINFDR